MVGKSEGKRLLGRLRRKWKDNIKMDLPISVVLTTCLCPLGLVKCANFDCLLSCIII
jgi:uncharacterized protein YceK